VRYIPAWMPFTAFRKDAKEGRKLLDRAINRPFEFVVEQMVSYLSLLLYFSFKKRMGTQKHDRAPPSLTRNCLASLQEGATDVTDIDIKWAAGNLFGGKPSKLNIDKS
jgi:hypothetical protein